MAVEEKQPCLRGGSRAKIEPCLNMLELDLVDARSLPLLKRSFGYPRAAKKVSIFAASMSKLLKCSFIRFI